MIIILRSENEQFSFIIGKNPLSPPLLKDLRSGKLLSFYIDQPSYMLYFKDSTDTASYPLGDDNQYLNIGQYCSAWLANTLLQQTFSTVISKQDEKDTPHKQKITIHSLYIANKRLYLELQAQGCVMTHRTGNTYDLIFEKETSLHEFLNIISIITLLIAVTNKEIVDRTPELIKKYIRVLNRLDYGADCGWNLKYLFKKNFRCNKQQLEELSTSRLKLTNGNSSEARAKWTGMVIPKDINEVVDIGCGREVGNRRELRHVTTYHLVDEDESVQFSHEKKGNTCYSSIFDFYEENADFDGAVIMTEVIEHNTKEEAENIVSYVLENRHPLVVISTPNYDFNKFFSKMGTKFRHPDHKWELTAKQFQEWLDRLVDKSVYTVQYHQIGDIVDGIAITSGAVITLLK